MANKNPVRTEEFKKHNYKPIGTDEKMGNKVFGTRVPVPVQEKLLSMPQKQRVKLIRDAIVNAVRGDNDDLN